MSDSNDAKIPFLLGLGWGIGTINIAILFNVKNVLFLKFVTDYMGIAIILAGTLLGVAKIFDALTDPLMGMISDRTNSKIGRRRPYLLLGSFMCAASLLILFSPPAWAIGSPGYVLFGLLWFSAAYTVFNVPYLAMPAEMTEQYHERSFLMSFRVGGIAVGQLLAIGFGPVLVAMFGGGLEGHAALAWVLAGLVLAAGLISFFSTAKAKFTKRAKRQYSLIEQFQAITQNKPFLTLLGAKFCVLTGTAFFQSAIAFYMTTNLGLSYYALGKLITVMSICGLLSLPFWLKLARHLDKRITAMLSLFIYAAITASWFFINKTDPQWGVYLRGALMGIAGSGLTLMLQSLLPDTIAYDGARTGDNREGIYAGAYTFAEKISYAVGAAITGIFLGLMGYVAGSQGKVVEQSDSALFSIALSSSFIPSVFFFASIVFLYRYKLTETIISDIGCSPARPSIGVGDN
ncbi:MAG: MFS transporter [Alphaproteobacteria bacterium]